MEIQRAGVDARAFRPMEEVARDDEFFDSLTVVANERTEIVGFASWNEDYISWLYVHPEFHGRGIGRSLITAVLDRIGPDAWTNTMGGNEVSIGLFKSVGMELVFERPSDCEGFPCTVVRLALPTSPMHNPDKRRQSNSVA